VAQALQGRSMFSPLRESCPAAMTQGRRHQWPRRRCQPALPSSPRVAWITEISRPVTWAGVPGPAHPRSRSAGSRHRHLRRAGGCSGAAVRRLVSSGARPTWFVSPSPTRARCRSFEKPHVQARHRRAIAVRITSPILRTLRHRRSPIQRQLAIAQSGQAPRGVVREVRLMARRAAA